MKPSYLLGAFIALWGVIISLPTAGMVTFWPPWLLWVVALGWGIVYSRRRLSLGLFGIQAATVAVATLASSPLGDLFGYPLAIIGVLVYSLGYPALWMAPFGIAHSFVNEYSTPPAEPHDTDESAGVGSSRDSG